MDERNDSGVSEVPGSREWLKARIAEHKAAQEQSLAQANGHAGAVQAYDRLLMEMEKPDAKG